LGISTNIIPEKFLDFITVILTGWTIRESNPGGARFSAPIQTGPGAQLASCIMVTGFFPGVKSGREVTLTPHPLLVPLVMKYRYTSTPLMGRTACTEPQCLYEGALYFNYCNITFNGIYYRHGLNSSKLREHA
jgi:hypothetical protein